MRLVGHEVISLTSRRWRGTEDVTWLTQAGHEGWLVFSCNKHQLEVEEERETILKEKVGVVYLSNGQENLHNVLLLLLRKWEWFELVDRSIPRPFAFLITSKGRSRRVI